MQRATRSSGWRYSLYQLLALVIVGACAEDKMVTPPPAPPPPPPAPPAQATVVVSIITTGSQPDDFYDLLVDGALWNKLSSNVQFEMPLPPGKHTLELADLASNCRATLGTRFSLELASSSRSAVSFFVVCPKLATLDISVATTGVTLDPDGYQLSVDALNIGTVGLQDHVHLDHLWPAPYAVLISGVAVNCSDPSGSTRAITLGDGQAAAVSFAISCQPRPDDTPGPKMVVSSSYSGNDNDLEMIDLVGGQRQRLTDDLGDDQAPDFSPDGNKILFVFWQPALHTSQLKIMDRATREETTLPTAGPVERAVWSPDGSQIAFVRSGSIYLMSADGSNERRLTSGHNDHDPYWSPSGSQLAMSRDQSVALVRVADGGVTTLVQNRLAGPWAPDGRHLVVNILECDPYYGCIYGLVSSDLAILDVGSKSELRLTYTPYVPEWSPVWSPDGQWVYYISAESGNPDVFKAALGGGGPVNLTNSTSLSENWVTLGLVGAPAASRSGLRRRP